jgi:hypothetical protein
MRVLERPRHAIREIRHEHVVVDASRDRSSRLLMGIDVAAALAMGAWLLAAVLGR